MKSKSIWMHLSFFALLFTTPAIGQAKISLEDLKIPHEVFVLDNGLTLIVHEDHSVPIVAVNTWYHVGSKNEREGRTGFAHLFEHFFFNGSENYPHGFREAMDDLGANNRNGTTNVDRTNFFEDVPVPALERTLYLEADRLGFLAGNLSEEMLERERGVVQNEKRQGENQPYGRVFSNIVHAIYPASHPYSWSTIGSMEDLDAATLDDIKEWYETYYSPNNVVLSLAGDITPERALELVEKYFGSIPPGPPTSRYEKWVPKLERNMREVMQDRVPQARIYRFWHAPGWGDQELIDLELFASVLSGSRSAPLDRAMIYDRELATSVTAFTWDKEASSNFGAIVTVKDGVDTAVAEKRMDEVIERLIEKGPSSAELERAKTRILAGFVKGMERLGGFGGRSDILAESMTYGDSTTAYLDRLQMVSSATPARVQAAAKKWLTAPHYTMEVVPFPNLTAKKNDLDRSVLPSIGDATDVEFPRVQRNRLDNGLEVILLERHSAPLVNMALAVDAGYASDPDGREGLAELAVDLLDDGTRTRDTFQIVDDLDALGASISVGNSLDLSLVRLRGLKATLAKSAEIFADVALNPSYPQSIVELEKKKTIAGIAQEKANPRSMVSRVLPLLVYPESHAYSTPMSGTGFASTVTTFSRDDLARWHATWFKPGSATLIVTGDVTMDELMPVVRKSFGGWQKGKAPEKNISPVKAANLGKVYLIDKEDAPQSVISAAHLSRPGGDDLDLALETLMRNFGGMSTSRLNRNLRLDKHWSYGSFGTVPDARGQRVFLVVAPVQTDKTKEAMAEVAMEIRGVAGERPVAGEEFASIMRNMTLRLPGRFETLSSLESAAIDLINLGYPEDYYSSYASNVRKLGERDLAMAGSTFVKPDELVWLIVGDLDEIEEGVRELGFGEIVHLDPDGNVIE